MCPIRKFGCHAQHCERPGSFLDLTFGKMSGEMVEGWAGWMGATLAHFPIFATYFSPVLKTNVQFGLKGSPSYAPKLDTFCP